MSYSNTTAPNSLEAIKKSNQTTQLEYEKRRQWELTQKHKNGAVCAPHSVSPNAYY